MGQDKEDLESLLPNGNQTPPKAEPLHAQEKPRLILGLPVQLVAGSAYCAASASMVLLNKATLSSFDFHAPIALLFFQCFVCVVLVQMCSLLGFIKLEPWSFKIARIWMPVNLIFVGMIWTSFFALKNLGVPMATVLKNVTNLFTIIGDYFLYGKVYGAGVWASLALMCASALCGSITDLAFDLEGYLWQLVNCLFTASYSLYLRGVMDKVVAITVNKTRLDEFSMVRYNNVLLLLLIAELMWRYGELTRFKDVFYNNVLSLPLIAVLMWWYGELKTLQFEPALQNPIFLFAACASSLVAFGISFASLWFLSTTTATTYSLVGSLNKIPVAMIGLVAFNVPWNLENLASILVGLVAGIVFVKAKSQPLPAK